MAAPILRIPADRQKYSLPLISMHAAYWLVS